MGIDSKGRSDAAAPPPNYSNARGKKADNASNDKTQELNPNANPGGLREDLVAKPVTTERGPAKKK
jgi:hypothetical protein